MTKLRAPGLLRPGEIARLFGIDESTVRLADEQGRFAADQRTPGGHRRYDPANALAFYDDLRRWAGKRHGSAADALAPESPLSGTLARLIRLEQVDKGRLARLSGSCGVEGCSWQAELPRSLGTAAGAREFALHLYAGHFLDEHYQTNQPEGATDGAAQESQAGRP